MSTLFVILAGVIVVLIVMSKIPGLEHFVKPLVGLLFSAVQVCFEQGSYWLIWGLKGLLAAHADLLRNLVQSAEDIDPSIAARNNEA